MSSYQYIDDTGVIVPDTSELLAGVQTEYKNQFGEDLIVTPDTPQGMLITAETLARTEVVNNNAALANQINPNIASGIWLDAILALTGMQRIAATKTVIESVVLTGVPNTIIPAGTKASNASGDIFESNSDVVLDASGNATVDFSSEVYGAVDIPANTLTRIVTNILGWETVNNPNGGILGAETQSDQSARAMRNNTLAFQSVSLPEAITSALHNVEGVTSLTFQENIAATTTTINGISMVAHSVYACVKGGTDLNVAAALLENKSSGAAWVGGTTVNIVEPASQQSYAVKFDRPSEIGVLIKVTTPNGSPTNVKNAILAWANNQVDGLEGFAVGVDVSPWEIAAAINQQYPETYITKVEISLTSPVAYSTDVIAIAVNQIARTELAYLSVVAS